MRNLAFKGALLQGLFLGLLLTGCLNTRNGEPIKPGQKPVFVSQQRVPGLNTPLPDHWRRVFVGELPRPRLDGYMRTRIIPRDDYSLTLHWVYDDHFHLVGVMTDLGKTTKFDKQGEPQSLGFLDTEEGLLALLGHSDRGKVHMVDMPAPAE
ncbi:MAG: hypothetical protein ACAI25_00025 [Planctomycetota bacterium]